MTEFRDLRAQDTVLNRLVNQMDNRARVLNGTAFWTKPANPVDALMDKVEAERERRAIIWDSPLNSWAAMPDVARVAREALDVDPEHTRWPDQCIDLPQAGKARWDTPGKALEDLRDAVNSNLWGFLNDKPKWGLAPGTYAIEDLPNGVRARRVTEGNGYGHVSVVESVPEVDPGAIGDKAGYMVMEWNRAWGGWEQAQDWDESPTIHDTISEAVDELEYTQQRFPKDTYAVAKLGLVMISRPDKDTPDA